LKSALSNLKDILQKKEKASHLLLFLDYDGTLTPIVKNPDKAILSPKTRNLLKSLTKKKSITVSIVSGRGLKKIKSLVGIKGLQYAGCHGLEISSKVNGYAFSHIKKYLPLIKDIKKGLAKQLRKVDGAQIEDKGIVLALHYRRVPKATIAQVKQIFDKVTKPYIESKRIRIGKGKKVLEVRPSVDWNKGKYCLYLLNNLKKRYKNLLPVYIGDDETDEAAFRALKQKGITIFVKGEKKTSSAKYYLSSTEEVVDFLKLLF